MQRKLIAACLLLGLVLPAWAQRGSSGRGAGTQARQRIHQPGTGQQTGAAVQKRDRKRDGTGLNCPNGPCVQQQTQTETEAEVQTRQQTQTQSGTKTRNKTQTKTQTRTQTQQDSNNPKN